MAEPQPKLTPKKDLQGINRTLSDIGMGFYDFFSPIGANLGNFAETVGRFVAGQPQAAAGQGVGDVNLRRERAQVARDLGFTLNTGAGSQQLAGPNQNFIYNKPPTGQQTSASQPGTATPATVAQAMARSGWRPGPSATLDPSRSPQRAQAAADAALEAGVRNNYGATTKMLADMLTQAQDRYGAAQGDVKSIFGTLANVRAADKAKINQQFISSINAAQQQQLARTQAAQQQLAMGQQGAATAGAELGAGPTQMPTDSLTSQAVAEGIADSNAQQGTWGNLMNAMNMQQQGNVDTSIQGYNYQQAAALDQLRKEYEDRLLGIQGQQASIEDQIAQAVSGAKASQAQAQAEMMMKQGDWQNELDKIRLKAALTPRGGSTPKGPDLKTQAGVLAAAGAAGITPQYIITNAKNAIDAASALKNNTDENGNDPITGQPVALKTPTAAEALSAWMARSGNSKNFVKLSPYVTGYIQSLLK